MNTGFLSGKKSSGLIKGEWVLGIVVLLLVGLMGWMFMDPAGWQNSAFMVFIRAKNLMFLAPEVMVTIVILASVLLLSFSKTREERLETWQLAVAGTALPLFCLILHFFLIYKSGSLWQNRMVFDGIFNADLMSLVVRTLLTFGTLLVLLFSRSFIERKIEVPGEFYVLLLSAMLGGMLLSGSTDLIMVFVSLETLSISSYVLVAYMRGNVLSAEAGLKYLLYGSMATAVLLFGLSILYGLAGYTGYPQIAFALNHLPHVNPLIMSIMTVMILGGVCFKLSAAPFHMWAPDAYEGAPTPVVAFLSVVSKIAAFAFAIRFFFLLLGPIAGWAGVLSVLSVVSMVIGNVVALTQKNIKRLLAYSTVAHVGYLLLGLVTLTQDGLASLLYYLMTYLFMNLGAFGVVTYFENQTGSTDIVAYAGLVRKKPLLAMVFSVMLLSLAGIPITAGFFGKFFLFEAVANAGNQYLWLVVVALLTSTISLYYYLNVIRLMVISEPSEVVNSLPAANQKGGLAPLGAFSLLLCLVGTLALGIFAQPVMTLSRQAIAQMAWQMPVAKGIDSHSERQVSLAK